MKLVFICSPYRGDIEANARKAEEYCKFAIKEGHVPIAPHLYFPRFFDDDDLGISMGLELLSKCSEIRVYGDRVSEGMEIEIQFAFSRKIPIIMGSPLLENEILEIVDRGGK